MAQPPSTYVAVAYARNGTAMVAQDFTQDHALAAKALRLPLGCGGAFASPYLALQDWMERWPESRERKSILLLSEWPRTADQDIHVSPGARLPIGAGRHVGKHK